MSACINPTPVRRTRRKSMSRRIVQDAVTGMPQPRQRGYVYQKQRRKGDPWDPKQRAYGRYRIDVPGERGQKDVRVALGLCRDELDAMLKLHEEMKRSGALDLDRVRERLAPAITFRVQAAWWLEEMTAGRIVNAKKRERIDPNTISVYRTAVAYLSDQIGDKPLASINNPEAKTLVAWMVSERTSDGKRRFSDKTVVEYFRVLRKVIASVLDEKFNPVHHREWNLAAICLPRVNPRKQCRPTFTSKEMTTLLSNAEGQFMVFYFFCAVTGLRVSEAIALEIDKHLSPDCSIVYVRQQREKHIGRVKPHLKTESGCRDVDVHPTAAQVLRDFIGNRRRGFLFEAASGNMFDPNNIKRDSLSSILTKMGRAESGTRFNVFRRFREAVLQRSEVRQILIDYWMGHSNATMADRYGRQLVEDVEYRQGQVTKVGLGFEVPGSMFGLRGLRATEVHAAA
jgi:integrase